MHIPERDIATCYQWTRIAEKEKDKHLVKSLRFPILKDNNSIVVDETIGKVVASHDHWADLYQKHWVSFMPGQQTSVIYPHHAIGRWATAYGPHYRPLAPLLRQAYDPRVQYNKIFFMFPGQAKTIPVKINGKTFNKRVTYDESRKGEGITWTTEGNAEAFIVNNNTINKRRMNKNA